MNYFLGILGVLLEIPTYFGKVFVPSEPNSYNSEPWGWDLVLWPLVLFFWALMNIFIL